MQQCSSVAWRHVFCVSTILQIEETFLFQIKICCERGVLGGLFPELGAVPWEEVSSVAFRHRLLRVGGILFMCLHRRIRFQVSRLYKCNAALCRAELAESDQTIVPECVPGRVKKLRRTPPPLSPTSLF